MKYQNIVREKPELFTNENALIEIITNSEAIENWQSKKKKHLLDKGLPVNWGDIGVVYEDPYIIILRDLVKFPSGSLGSYFRILNTADLEGGKAIVVLPIFDNKILLLRQFRHPTRMWHWEIPRGFGEPNTIPEENARKEILEEIEGEVSELISLGTYHSNTGIEGAEVELFLAKLEHMGATNQNEGIESFKLFEQDDVKNMIRDSEITDGFTIAAFARAKYKELI